MMAEERRGAARVGRPRRESAGEVEARILEAAAAVFLRHGYDGASIDEIAVAAHAGKPTIYARYPGKEALFSAVVAEKVRRNATFETPPVDGLSSEEQLRRLAAALLDRALASEALGLVRVAVAESRRFPELASRVGRMARERGHEAVALQLGELARADEMSALNAFAPEHLAATTRRFTEMVVLPIVLRALLGESLELLRAEVGPHIGESVAFFLAACRASGRADDGASPRARRRLTGAEEPRTIGRAPAVGVQPGRRP